jgi:hypothetical protein
LVRSFRSSPDETRKIAIDLEFTSDGTERKDFDRLGLLISNAGILTPGPIG